jgi:DoxX-like family
MAIESVSKARYRAGWAISGLIIAFLVLDGVMKIVQPPEVIQANLELGYSQDLIMPIGVILLLCTLLYALPRTRIWGALFLTAYLGGAMATHVRAGAGIFPKVFTVAVAVLIWAGLVLRDQPLERLLFRSTKP